MPGAVRLIRTHRRRFQYRMPGKVDFGRNEPTITNGAFTFPGPSGVAGYFYTKPPATMAQSQTVTLVYSIDGTTPVWAVSDPTDVPRATMHLFLWRGGDDLSCNGVMA